MKRKIQINQDVLAGLMFAAFGSFFLFFGRNYPVGTALRMGPGYMPQVLGWLLVGIGAFIGVKGALKEGEDVKEPLAERIKRDAAMATGAVGLITEAAQAVSTLRGRGRYPSAIAISPQVVVSARPSGRPNSVRSSSSTEHTM